MVKQAPSLGTTPDHGGFAFSCVAILLYLWLTFGGAVPLRAKGYRVTVNFPEASSSPSRRRSDLRGHRREGRRSRWWRERQIGPLTAATLEIDNASTRRSPRTPEAVLRQKTLLGETYVELTPGNRGQDDSNTIPDEGNLPNGQVAPTVQLDEIFRTFDPVTRLRSRPGCRTRAWRCSGAGRT